METQTKWLVRPLTAGSKLQDHSEDGRISAMLVMCIVISSGVVLHISYFIPLPEREIEFQHDLRLVLILYKTVCVSLSLGIMLWYFFRADSWAKSGILAWKSDLEEPELCIQDRRPYSDRAHAHAHSNNAYLSIAGVFLFGSGKFVLTLFYTIDTVECLQLKTDPRAKDDQTVEYVSLVYLIITLLFTAVQMGFLKKFQIAIFRNSCWFQYTLTIVFFMNILQWLLDFIEDFFMAVNKSNNSPDEEFEMVMFGNGSSGHDIHCLNHETEFDKFLEKAEPYMAPFKLEFSLMSAGMIYSIHNSVKDMAVEDDQMGANHAGLAVSRFFYSLCPGCCRMTGDDGPDRQVLRVGEEEDVAATDHPLPPDDGGPTSSTEDTPSDRERDVQARTRNSQPGSNHDGLQNIARHTPHCGVGFVVGIVSVLILLVLCGLLADKDGDVRDGHIMAYNVYRTVHCMALLVASWLGFKAIRDHHNLNRPVQPEETLFIICVTGLFLFRMFHYIAAAGSPNYVEGVYPRGLPRLLSAFATTNIVAAFIQATFLLTAMKYRPHAAASGRLVAEIAAFLLVSNLGIWLLDSFFQVNSSINTDPLETWFYREEVWYIASHLTLPLDIFFRFHSFVVGCEIYANFKDHAVTAHSDERIRTV